MIYDFPVWIIVAILHIPGYKRTRLNTFGEGRWLSFLLWLVQSPSKESRKGYCDETVSLGSWKSVSLYLKRSTCVCPRLGRRQQCDLRFSEKCLHMRSLIIGCLHSLLGIWLLWRKKQVDSSAALEQRGHSISCGMHMTDQTWSGAVSRNRSPQTALRSWTATHNISEAAYFPRPTGSDGLTASAAHPFHLTLHSLPPPPPLRFPILALFAPSWSWSQGQPWFKH